MGRYDALTEIEEKENNKTSLLAKQQTSKPAKKQASISTNQQTSKETNSQTSKEVNQLASKPAKQHTSTLSLSTKEKKKYGTYLRDDSISNIQVEAIQKGKKDHDMLQEIVDFYFEIQKR